MRTLRAVALVLLGALAGCSRCGKEPAPTADVARYLPRDADAVVVVPELAAFGNRLALLERLKVATVLAQLSGLPDAHAYVGALMEQAGLDLRSTEALAAAGLDARRGAGAALFPKDQALLVLPVSSEAKLEEYLKRLAGNRLGATVQGARPQAGATMRTFSPPAGPPRLAYVVREGFAAVAIDEAISRLTAWSTLAPHQALSSEAELAASLSRLPAPRQLWAHFPAGGAVAAESPLGSFTAAASLDEGAFTLRVDVPWKKPFGVLQAVAPQRAPDLVGLLPADAFAVGRFTGDATALAPYAGRLVGPWLERAFREEHLDLGAEVLGNLAPGAVVGVAVAPDIPLGGGLPELDVRQTNPFRYVHLVIVAPSRDPQKAQAVLDRLPAVAPRFGAKIEPATRDARAVFLTRYAQGEGIHLGRSGEKVVLASPAARLDQALQRLEGTADGGASLAPQLGQVLDQSAAGLVIDLSRLSESIRALPDKAWGIGGFKIKASALRWLDATDDLVAITLQAGRWEGTADAGGARPLALQLEARLLLRAAPERAP